VSRLRQAYSGTIDQNGRIDANLILGERSFLELSKRSAAALAATATLAFAGSGLAMAEDSPAWTTCQGHAAAIDLDQLVDRCGGGGRCQDPADTIDLDQIIAGCTVVIQSPAEPPLRRALAAYQRGAANARKGDRPQAISDFSLALSLRPDFAEAIEHRGAVYAASGDDVSAIRDFGVALRLNPNMAKAYAARAQSYFHTGEYDQAIADASRVIALAPGDAAALNNRCWMRAANGRDLMAALDDCNEAVLLRPNDPVSLDSRGFVHIRMKDYAAAAADYGAALEANPKLNDVRASSLYGRGIARIALGDRAAAQADLVAALTIAPGIGRTYAGLGLKP
jgi:tetratricopeptide (TPR) repeat protein